MITRKREEDYQETPYFYTTSTIFGLSKDLSVIICAYYMCQIMILSYCNQCNVDYRGCYLGQYVSGYVVENVYLISSSCRMDSILHGKLPLTNCDHFSSVLFQVYNSSTFIMYFAYIYLPCASENLLSLRNQLKSRTLNTAYSVADVD